MSAYDHFLIELLGDPGFAPSAPELRRAIEQVDLESDGNPHALQFYEGVCWIMNQRQRPLRERVEKISEFAALRGRQVINLREFCGW
jgi:hypothetical protein